jgi:DNA ligase-associated metallophosphoesterase
VRAAASSPAAAVVALSSPGSLELEVAGQAVLCRPSGALWIAAERALVVADLHLEKASYFASRGQMLPPYDTAETLRRLAGEIAALAPALVVFLGDSFHDREGEARLAAADIAALRAVAEGRMLVWITGNHDPDAPRALPGDAAATLPIGPLRLVHEPEAAAAPGEIAGHLHPCARVAARGASVRRRCFVTDGTRLILPAFGALAGGLNIRDGAFRALLRPRPLAGVLGANRVHAVGWSALRDD